MAIDELFDGKKPAIKPESKVYDGISCGEVKDYLVDYIGNDRFVFNIGGNNYRLIAIIRFNIGRVFIRFIGTHTEYDKIVDIKKI